MKESYGEGIAIHADPESCAAVRKGVGEALTGVRAGQVLSREKERIHRGADAVTGCGRQHPAGRHRKTSWNPARSETLCMHGNTSPGNREIPRLSAKMSITAGRIGKFKDARR
jgi:hypothetical protein